MVKLSTPSLNPSPALTAGVSKACTRVEVTVVKPPSFPSAGLIEFAGMGLFCRTKIAIPLEVYFAGVELKTVLAIINERRTPGATIYHLRNAARKMVDKLIICAPSRIVNFVHGYATLLT